MDFEEKQRVEVVKRMKLWGVSEQAISQFKDDGLVSTADTSLGDCSWLEEGVMGRVRCFEEDENAVVYHVIFSKTEIGYLESYLFVSKYEKEWEDDFKDIEKNQGLAYVRNINYPDCSEFGYIGVELSQATGLVRIW